MRGPVLGLAPSCHPSDTTEPFHPRRSLFNLSAVPGASCVVRATKDHMRTCRFFTCCLVMCSRFYMEGVENGFAYAVVRFLPTVCILGRRLLLSSRWRPHDLFALGDCPRTVRQESSRQQAGLKRTGTFPVERGAAGLERDCLLTGADGIAGAPW